MATRIQMGLALGVTVAVIALAGCGGSGNPFTIKANDNGDIAYLVVHTAAPQQVIEPLLLERIRRSGATAFVTSSMPLNVALDCSRHPKIGESGIPPAALHPYIGDEVSIDVYGSGPFADGICSGLDPNAIGG